MTQRGFTLIELLAAMAILAVVSLMAVQSLSGALFQRDVMTRVDQNAEELARALALLRHDLEAVAPLVQRDDAGQAQPAILVRSTGFSVMRAGISALPGAVSDGFGRVDWELSPQGTLSRRLTPNLGAEVSPLIPILSDVSSLSLEALAGTMPTAEEPTLLPSGFSLRLTHAQYGDLHLVIAR